MRPALDQLHDAMQDVKPGDRYALTLKDDDRLILEFNDSEVITLNDPLLAKAYLNIWLGKDPIDKSLKMSLLGQT
ncbi:MAG: chalcone isomerase family protein, partial [Candidatus Thiodiazotropha taylori]